MKLKEVIEGKVYILTSSKRSNVASSHKYFELLRGKEVKVIKKFNDYQSKNSILIKGKFGNKKSVTMWCSPHDLSEGK